MLLYRNTIQRNLDQRVHHTTDVADKGAQDVNLQCAQAALATGVDSCGQQHIDEVQHGPQQPGVDPQGAANPRSLFRNEAGFTTPLIEVIAQLLGQFKHEVHVERMRGL